VVLGCGCGVELVVCVSVVRVCVCFWVVVWFFGAVFGWAFGCQRACGVCSRLLEMADVRIAAKMAIIAMTTNSSISVKPRRFLIDEPPL